MRASQTFKKTYRHRQQKMRGDPTPEYLRAKGSNLAEGAKLESSDQLWRAVREICAHQGKSFCHKSNKNNFMAFCSRDVLPDHAARLRALLVDPSPDEHLFCPFLVVATYAHSRDEFVLGESACSEALETPTLIVRRSILVHLCGDPTSSRRRTSSHSPDVAATIAHVLAEAPKTGLKALRAVAVKTLQELPSNSMLKRGKRIVLRGEAGKFTAGADLQLLPAFMQRINAADDQSLAEVRMADDGHSYLGWFIAPGCGVRALGSGRLRALFTTDAAHITGPEEGQLVGFHCFGPGDELVKLAAAHILGESEDSWTWFLTLLCRAFPGLDDLVCHLITDGDKGLKAAVRHCLPQAYHATCAFHRAQKLSEQRKTMPLLLKMAGAYTLDQYNGERVKLQSEASSASFATVDLVAANRFCLAHMPSNEDEAKNHWHDCKQKSCEFSALHYDGDPDEFDSWTLFLRKWGISRLLLAEQAARARKAMPARWRRKEVLVMAVPSRWPSRVSTQCSTTSTRIESCIKLVQQEAMH